MKNQIFYALLLHQAECLTVVMTNQVLDIFKKDYFGPHSINKVHHLEEMIASMVIETFAIASNGEWLTWKTGTKDVNRFE